MSIKTTIQGDIVTALKSHDQTSLSVLRLLISGIKNIEIDKKTDSLSDEEVISFIQKQVKQRRESMALYAKGGRLDLADNEEKELPILNKYLPQQLSGEEVNEIIDKAIAGLGQVDQKDFGTVMKKVMELVRGRAEGNVVADLIKQKLG